ncbi:MAG TPA: signal recognition particle subunit SRP19/SEC65 family protein [Thermoplasmata archaeon]|nr:signal recognition particle subunit SRP19/SEC65 family protein [Thermoplasmata archaeon]
MPDHFYAYPAYFRRGSSRADGRRVPKPSGVDDVTSADLLAAAQALGYQATPEPEKQYPRQFYRYEGRIKLTKKKGVTKAAALRDLAGELQKRSSAARRP